MRPVPSAMSSAGVRGEHSDPDVVEQATGPRRGRLRLAARWLFGLGVMAWTYLREPVPIRRVEERADESDLPPAVPEALLDERSQPAETGHARARPPLRRLPRGGRRRLRGPARRAGHLPRLGPPRGAATPPASLYDHLGRGFTLLRLAGRADTGPVTAAARASGVPLTVLDAPDLPDAAAYGAPLLLVRPDQHVAWRGSETAEAAAALDVVRGADVVAASARHRV